MAAYKTQIVEIDGMHCDACVRRVTQALGAVKGARVQTVEVGKAMVVAEATCEPELRRAVTDAGFVVTAVRGQG
jgi:copper chaperone